MSRHHAEWQRLYAANGPPSASGSGATDAVRALVLEVARPADWSAVGALWQGVQNELGLPAPAIAVNGRDGYQLWFSLAQAVPAAEAHAWLATLQARYLNELAAERVTLWPAAPDSPANTPNPVPSPIDGSDHWSSFVAADLAPIFATDPWLDFPPGDDAQADILLGLRSMPLADFRAARERLMSAVSTNTATPPASSSTPGTTPHGSSPKVFLQQVMSDPSVPLALRIEAAKALLPYTD